MSGFFTGILEICLLLSAPVSGQDVNEERIDQSLPFNKSLLLYTEASQNLRNVTGTIADLNEAIKETTKLKNEVKKFSTKVLDIKRNVWAKEIMIKSKLNLSAVMWVVSSWRYSWLLMRGLTSPNWQAVSVWLSWMMANSLCEGGLNMTGAESLWRQSR